MRDHIRRFLLMLLVLALPLQGVAAAAMPGCPLGSPASAETEGMTAGCHEPEQADHPSAGHDCKQCAACVLASALPIPSADSAAAIALRHGFPLSAVAGFTGFIPDAPERPPRPDLA